jgi:hypothetical protein
MKDKYIESRGVRITVRRDLIKVEATEQLPNRPLLITIDREGQRLTGGTWNPGGNAFKIIPPLNTDFDVTTCDVTVKDGTRTVCQWKSGTKTISVQCGWMKCIVCSDSRLRPGQMWVGHDKFGQDEWVECPECHGECRVPQYKIYNPETGLEIDYERQSGELLIV